jgi:hypothetical protein
MCQQAQHRDTRRLRQPVDDRAHVPRPEAEAIHARVHLDEDFDRPRKCRGFEHSDLLHIVHYNGQSARSDLGQLAVGEKTLEQEDAPCIVALAQRHGGVELEQRQPVGLRERRKNAAEPVSIRVRFDDGKHLCICSTLVHLGEIRAQRRQIDLGYEWAGHDIATTNRRCAFGMRKKTWYKARAACAGCFLNYIQIEAQRTLPGTRRRDVEFPRACAPF